MMLGQDAAGAGTSMPHDFERMRRNMLDGQILPSQVTDPALVDALLAVPRERFVPERLRPVAYIDEDLPLGGGRHLAEPRVFASLVQAAAVGPDDVVLDVGAGPGYSTAILARLASAVVALEEDPALADRAEAVLAELGVDNVAVVRGPLVAGWPKEAPYDVILFGGTVHAVPDALAAQLADAGRLVAVEGDGRIMGKAVMTERPGGAPGRRPLFDAAMPLLPGFGPVEEFAF